MGGDRIEAAQTALLVFLKSLPPGCYFNIVGFGSSFALLFPEYGILVFFCHNHTPNAACLLIFCKIVNNALQRSRPIVTCFIA